MKDRLDPTLGSSSIGSRVRSRSKVGVEPRESMNSLDLSLDLVGETYSMKKLLQLPASRFLPPGSGYLPPGLGPCLHPLASRPSDLSCLRINGNLPLIR